jgi:copper chaperone CopZ
MKTIVSTFLFLMLFVSCTTHEEKIIVKNAKPKVENKMAEVKPNHMLTVEIEGMSCEMNCGGSIRKGLKKTGAVSRVEFKWVEEAEKQITNISYDDTKMNEKQIVALIETLNEGQFTTYPVKSEKISSTSEKK